MTTSPWHDLDGKPLNQKAAREALVVTDRNLKSMPPPCPHPRADVYTWLAAIATRSEPAEYDSRAQCRECGKWLDPSDLPKDCEINEISGRPS